MQTHHEADHVDSAHPISKWSVITAIFVTIYFGFAFLSWRIKSDSNGLDFPQLSNLIQKLI